MMPSYFFSVYSDFNPRSLAGATLIDLVLSAVAVFQSTLPHGSDRGRWPDVPVRYHFNPRSLTGATLRSLRLRLMRIIFQSTLPHGSDG